MRYDEPRFSFLKEDTYEKKHISKLKVGLFTNDVYRESNSSDLA